jgi:hypothetical protein
VQVVFAGEKVRPDDPEPAPSIAEFVLMQTARTLPFEALVRMKLTSYRRKDQVHIQDLIAIGLVDETWLPRLSPELAARLQELLADPEG